ncbi:trypsin-like serine peptidase [Marilutibacter spongiae]|uniref:Peptidase n=1 Tax=Marilutibacter spongiae TaxID=2025720 RepID=A0A7W3TJJ2_9GAMM|nr:hypothetical protein [Lysobacter spongiae]MBB1059502.1 hypothetical protein [Lysobacter spongiae]
MEARNHNRQSSPATRPSRAPAMLAALALVAMVPSAFAAEKRVRMPEGDVVQLEAPRGAQQTLTGALGRPHPFATAEQRSAVAPLPWLDDAAMSKPAKGNAKPAPELRGPAGDASGGAAPPFAEYLARGDFAEAWRDLERMEAGTDAKALGDGTVSPQDGAHYGYVRYPGNLNTSQWLAAPWNKIGKLYFTTPSGGSSYCTANVASGNSVLITAAHCVYTRGQGFNSNFVFVPADRYGVAPYGKYGWQSATVLNNWINDGGRRWDVAVIRLAGEQSSGRPVTDYVGWLGRSWNQPYVQYTYSHGYASNISTQYTSICRGYTYSSSNEGSDVLVQGCDMTYGSSGGGWLRNYTPNSHSGNHVNAVVSGPHIGDFGQSYVGPRFSSSNIVPLCNAAGC